MVAVPKQTELAGLDDPADEEAEIEAGYVWREALWSAMRRFASSFERTYRDGSRLKGYDAAAKELDTRWAPKGRPVTAAVLGAALRDSERNNFRAEWLDWFAARSQEVAELLGRRVKPKKTPEEFVEDVLAEMREEFSHKTVERIVRRAKSR